MQVFVLHLRSVLLSKKRYRGHRAIDEVVHGNEHRMAARGNATSFPLPWQDLLTQLSETAKLEGLGKSVSLRRTGEELMHFVLMLFENFKCERRR